MTESRENTKGPSFLQLKKVYLRKISTADVEGNYIDWLNDRKITQNLETGFFPIDVEGAREYVERQVNDDDTLFLAIVDKTTEEHIGNIKLGPINWIHRRAMIGILIGEKEYWGRGIATECIQTLAEYAFDTLNLHKLVAGCYEKNVGSKKAFKKVGFSEEGRRVEHAHCEGEYTDLIEFGLIRSGFEA